MRRLRGAAVERTLPCRDLVGPVRRSLLRRGRLRRRGGELRCRRRALRRWCVALLLTAVVLHHRAAFCDHLIEAAVESRQRVGDEIRRMRVCVLLCGRSWRWRRTVHDRRDGRRRNGHRLRCRRGLWRGRGLRGASLRHALKLPRQVIETVMHGREAIIEVLVVNMVAI
jgi:hypothetical protein